MTFKTQKNYELSTVFTDEELLQIQPEDLVSYFNVLAYGVAKPGANDLPKKLRSGTLEFHKKAISSFMPLRTLGWNAGEKKGNPSRSDAVNKCIKRVKKFEVRHQGVASNAWRPIDIEEFVQLLSLLASESDLVKRHRIRSLITLQWQIIGRIDDMMQLVFSSIVCSIQHPFALIVQFRWSKNIPEERQTP